MSWVELVILLAVIQTMFFGVQAGRARGRYGLPAPAMSGNEVVERYLRVHLNTIESMIIFLPSIYLAGRYTAPYVMAALGAIYLIGRMVYYFGYVSKPEKRHLGYMLSMIPVLILILCALFGVIRAIVMTGA